jgi:Amt family ammonium transporter
MKIINAHPPAESMMNKLGRNPNHYPRLILFALVLSLFTQPLWAQTVPEALEILDTKLESRVNLVQTNLNIIWTLTAAILVFFMQAGFMLLELGFSRAKNTINVIMKNFLDCAIVTLIYFFFGYGLMFGQSLDLGGFGVIGTSLFGLSLGPDSLNAVDRFADLEAGVAPGTWTHWIFQAVFAATAVTIVSGTVAERTKFRAYLFYSAVIGGLIYPVVGHWCWSGGGWLAGMGFTDFAGSTVVHATGGACALAGAILVGPRVGRFGPDGSPRLIVGHNLPMAALGTFILWFCWFGFNAGSTVAGTAEVGIVAVNTNLAAAAGAVFAMLATWLIQGRSDIAIALNGALAGLVAITAGCYDVTPLAAVVIGIGGGLCASFGSLLLESFKIDDVVGAIPVHLFAGIWGTIAVGLAPLMTGGTFSWQQLQTQTIGTLACSVFAFVAGLGLFALIRLTIGLRASETEQIEGLDFHEHAATAYPDFTTTEQNL